MHYTYHNICSSNEADSEKGCRLPPRLSTAVAALVLLPFTWLDVAGDTMGGNI